MTKNGHITLTLIVSILTMGGCSAFQNYEGGLTQREVEKTKQLQIQAKIDSIKAVNKQI